MKELICIVCPRGCRLSVDEKNGFRVTGNHCPRGEAYGKAELQNPVRTLTSTVRITGAAYPRLPVKTDRPIPKHLVAEAMTVVNRLSVSAPVRTGDVLVPDLLGTGANLVATRDLEESAKCRVQSAE